MNSLEFAEFFDFLPFRRARGKYTSPHFSFKYLGVVWHVDSSKGRKEEVNIITHAHTDHYGQRNVNNPFALASEETAKILEVYCDKKFEGRTFKVGEKIKIKTNEANGKISVKTFETYHMHGSSAFLFDNGVLITGDVKDYKKLPKCKVLITEATYGSPEHVFEDEIDRLLSLENGAALGAYPIGKSQRVANLLTSAGREVCADEKVAKICSCLGIDVKNTDENFDVFITSPRNLYLINSNRKYVLTAQNFYSFPRIVLSDHLDYEGILKMIEHCNPEEVLFYHGTPSKALLEEVKGMGYGVTVLKELERLKVN